MGHGRDLFAQNKTGKTFPVEVSLSHYVINNETFVIAFVIDITVRKEQEVMAVDQTKELERVTAEIRYMNSELEQKVEDRTKMLREALSELELSQKELSLAFEKEKELGELKSRFVTVASHEFRTPLSTILSSAYLVEKYSQVEHNPKVDKHLARIKNSVEGMKNILEDFLSLGKMEEGLVSIKMVIVAPASIDELFQDLMQELEGLLKTGQKVIIKNLLTDEVLIDKDLIKKIMINLVSNAIKFTEENKTIVISASLLDENLIISVEDEGMGIPVEDQQHLFERFFRAKNVTNIQGTGLGLHIVVKYLELMNGRIDMKSKPEEGTTFTIYIPQNQKQNEENIDN
jgi:signal transduction histidine kinase